MFGKRWSFVALLSVLILFVTSCSSGGSSSDGAEEGPVTTEASERSTDAGGDDGASEPGEETDDQADEPAVEPIDLDVAVQYAGIRYDIADMEVDDTRDDNVALPVELTFNVQVENLLPDTHTPGAPVTLQWELDGDMYQTTGQTDFRDVPSGATSRGTISVHLTTADLETWDQDSSQLLIGSDNHAQAVVPLDGSDPITRLPVTQDESVEFDLEGFQFESDEVWVAWHQTLSGTPADDGSAWLIMRGTVHNAADSMHCVRQRSGVEPKIELLDGTSRVFHATTLNCLSSGDTERDALISFELDDPFAGTYTITVDGIGDGVVTMTVTLTDDGVPADDENDDGEDDDDDEADDEE